MNEESFYKHNSLFSRRDFLRLSQGACAGMGMGALTNTLMHQKLLAAVSSTGDLNASDDYKALVCIFMFGGNDGMNCFLPTTNFENYTRDRNQVALQREGLHDSARMPGFAFHQELPFFRDAFDAGNLAVVGNVGTLVEPVRNRDAFLNPRSGVVVPPQLFSHNDQQTQWQTSLPGSDSPSGWGGRIGDAARNFNENASVSVSVNVGRANVFTVGDRETRLDLGGGQVTLSQSGPSGIAQAAADIRNLQNPHLFRQEFANITSRSLESQVLLNTIINNTPSGEQVGARFQERPSELIFQQLRSVSQMINARNDLGLKRQIFFVNHNNFDTHGDQLAGHSERLEILNRAVELFCEEIDGLGLADNVTTFTTTEFGRTYSSNANGTDHGWGNNHFVIGGAVDGGRIHNELPDFEINGQQDAGFGRWIPSASTDEYAATLARWFGISESDMSTVVPNIGRFGTNFQDGYLGFLGNS